MDNGFKSPKLEAFIAKHRTMWGKGGQCRYAVQQTMKRNRLKQEKANEQ